MGLRLSEITLLAMALLCFAIGAYAYARMPEQVASHWNAQGEVDGYMAKPWGVFLLPAVFLCLFLIFAVLPRLDPLRANIRKFVSQLDNLMLLVGAFFFYVYVLTLAWNLGARFNMSQLLAPAFAALFFYLGILLENAKRNWFIGIRTPWTLSSDRVWNKTHALGGKLFKAAGLIALLGLLLPQYAILFVLAPVLVAAVGSTAYSYLEYRKLHK